MAYNSPLALKKGIISTFEGLLQTAPKSVYDQFIEKTSSNTNQEDYWIPSTLPGFVEWVDHITYSDFEDDKLTVKNKHYQRGFELERDYLSDTRAVLGNNIEKFIKLLIKKYVAFPDKLVAALLAANSNAFDKTAFFATSRPNLDTGSNTINNLASGTLSTAYTTSTFSADLQTAKNQFNAMKDKDDEPFHDAPKYIALIPTHFEGVAKKVLTAESYIDAGTSQQTSNIYRGDAEIVLNTRQSTSDNDWYLIDANSDFLPFLIQNRQGVNWHMKDDEENRFIRYWAEFRMGYEFLNPMSIVKINN